MKRFTDAEWKGLPLKMRRRYWRETDYGRQPPTEDLMRDMRAAIATAAVVAKPGAAANKPPESAQ